MRHWSKSAFTFFLGLGLWTLCFCFYCSRLPVNYTYDGMVFAERVENFSTPLYKLFHPHHLIYTYLGRLFYSWGRENGASWDGMVALQFFDILIGTFGILIAFHLLVRKTNDRLIAFLSALGLAFTFSYWYFSTSPGVRIFAAVTPLLAWYILTYLKNKPPAFGLIVGFTHALAVLGHQTNLLLLPAFLGGIWCLRKKNVHYRLKACFYYLTALALGVLGVYGFIGRFIYLHKTYESWIYWVFAYFHIQQWGGYEPTAGFEQGKFAMLQAFLIKTGAGQAANETFTFEYAREFFQYALCGILGFLLLRFKFYWNQYRQTLCVGLLWIGSFVPFFIWWEPWNIEFWVSSTVPCWILMGVVASDLSLRWKNPVLHFANRGIVLFFWAGIIALLFLYNFQGAINKPAVSKSPKLLLEALDWKVRVDDLLVLGGINTVPLYLDRYQKRNYLSLHSILVRRGLLTKDPKAVVPDTDPWNDLSDCFLKTWNHHRRVWVLSELIDRQNDWYQKLEHLLRLPDGQIAGFFSQYKLTPIAYHRKIYFYEVVQPIPPPTISAEPSASPGPVVNPQKIGKVK